MKSKDAFTTNNAARMTASIFGALAGIGGIIHGIGEMRQGNVTPGAFMFNSWAEGPILAEMGGDPALSIIPNLLLTGILATLVGIAMIVWAAAFVQQRHGGLILILLGVTLLLVGGGVGPPVTCVLAGVAGLAVRSPLTWWRNHMSANVRRVLASLWPWVFGIGLLNGLFLFVGSLVIINFVRLNNSDIYLNSFYFVVLSLLAMLVTGVAYDIEKSEQRLSVAR